MKLDALKNCVLTESSINLSEIEDIDDNVKSKLAALIGIYASGFKLTETNFNQTIVDSRRNRNILKFTNGLLDLEVGAHVYEVNNKKDVKILSVSYSIAEKFYINRQNETTNSKKLINFTEYFDDLVNEIDRLMEHAEKTKEIVSNFVKWYFQIAGNAGKIKLIGGNYNLVDGYFSSSENRFTAIAGDFCVDQDAMDTNIQSRILK